MELQQIILKLKQTCTGLPVREFKRLRVVDTAGSLQELRVTDYSKL